jgi:zinc protease
MDWKGGKMKGTKMLLRHSAGKASLALCGLVCVLLPSASFGADAAPTAENLLDRFVEVTGGKAAYEKRKTEVDHGTVEFAVMGLKGTVVQYYQPPGEFYMAMELPGVGKIESGLTDGVAWENSVLQGPRIKTGEEKAQSLRAADMNSFGHWRDVYKKAEVAGEEIVEGEPCYKVVLTPTQGRSETVYFEKKSGLMRKTTVVAASQFGDIAAETISTEYRRFEGILAPAKITEKVAGQSFTITIETVETNTAVPAEKFALPEDVKLLLAKTK